MGGNEYFYTGPHAHMRFIQGSEQVVLCAILFPLPIPFGPAT